MSQIFVNNGVSTLAANVAATDTTIFIQAGHVARFPTIAAPDYCFVTLENAGGALEIVKVTAHAAAAASMTIVRAQQGTTALDWLSGDLVELRLTKEELNRFERAALRDGDTHSGVHDFTGATLKVKTPTLANEAAPKAFVETFLAAAAAAGAAGQLPNQAGKKGFLKTNGVTADWASPGSGGVIVTGNISLSVLSEAVMVAMPTAYGFYATLPDAMTLDEGLLQYAFYNQSVFPYGVKNFAGVILGWIPPLSGATLALADNTSAAGIWSGTGLSKVAITSEFVPTNQNAQYGQLVRRVTLDANREFFFFQGGNDWGCVYDSSTDTYGSMTNIGSSLPNSVYFDIVLVSANLLLLTWHTGGNPIQVKAMTISVSGSSITPNTAGTQTYTGTYSGQYISRTLSIGNTHITGWAEGSSEHYVMAMTISGTTPVFGTPRALSSGGSNAPFFVNHDGILAAIINTNNKVECTPFSISGNSLTYGTLAYLSHATTNYTLRAYRNGAGNIFVQHDGGVAVFKIVGTVASVSNYSTGTPPANMNYSAITPISTNKVLVSIRSSSGGGVFVYLITDTNGVASGTYNNWDFYGGSFSAITTLVSAGNIAKILLTSSGYLYPVNIDCSTASPTLSKVVAHSFSSGLGVAYGSGGQDEFGNVEPRQLRTTTKDIWCGGSGYAASLQISNNEIAYLYGNTGASPNVRGRADSIAWSAQKPFTNDGLTLKRVEVCE